MERDSLSSSSGSGTGPNPPQSHLHRMYFSSRTGSREGNNGSSGVLVKEMHSVSSKDKMSEKDIYYCDKDMKDDDYSSYVQFAREYPRPHDYSYPVIHPDKKYSPSSDLSNSLSFGGMTPKKPLQLDPLSLQPPPLLPTKSTGSSTKKKRCFFI